MSQYLTENDLLAKFIQHKGDVARDCFAIKTAFLQSLSENYMDETLRKILDEVIESHSPYGPNFLEQSEDDGTYMSENISAIESILDEASKSYISLKEPLQVSDGVFMKNFCEARNKFNVSVEKQQKMLNGHVFLEWTEDLKRHLEIALKEALKSVKIPKVLNFELEPKNFTTLIVKKYKLTVIVLGDWENEKTVFSENSYKLPFWTHKKEIIDFNSETKCSILMTRDTILSILDVNVKGSLVERVSLVGDYLALYEEYLVRVYSPDEDAIVYEFSLDMFCDALDVIQWQNGTFSCLLWNPLTSEVQFSDTDSTLFCLSVKETPSLVEQFEEFCCFAFTDNSVMVWDTDKDRYFEISKLQHGLSTVDRTKFVDEDTLYLFDYKLLLMVEISFQFPEDSLLNKCSVQRVIKITPFTVNSINHMTVMDEKIIAYADGNVFATELND